jgi:hypothetical protein
MSHASNALPAPLPATLTGGRTNRGSGQPYPKFRVLLALDGTRLTPALLAAAVSRCVHLSDRIDILLVNPPKAPTSLLRVLLLRLEHAGIDYRLASSEGDLGEHVEHYLKRFLGISLVLVDHLTSLQQSALGPKLAEFCHQGYRFEALDEAPPG